MPGIASEVVQNRNLEIVEKFYGSAAEGIPARSNAELSKEYGLSVSTIQKILQQDLERNGPRERAAVEDPTCRLDTKPISHAHAVIGNRVSEYMERNKLRPTMFGAPLRLSRHKVRAIMMGVYDLTLTDIQRISKILSVPVGELCAPKEIHVC